MGEEEEAVEVGAAPGGQAELAVLEGEGPAAVGDAAGCPLAGVKTGQPTDGWSKAPVARSVRSVVASIRNTSIGGSA